MFEKKCKSTETNVYDGLWYLREDVSEISQERRGVGIICILEKVRRVCVCDIFEIWRLVKMEKWCLRSLYMGNWSEWGLSCPKASGKSQFVGFALHRWMCNSPKKKKNKEGYLSKVVMGSTFIINITKGFFLKIRLKP